MERLTPPALFALILFLLQPFEAEAQSLFVGTSQEEFAAFQTKAGSEAIHSRNWGERQTGGISGGAASLAGKEVGYAFSAKAQEGTSADENTNAAAWKSAQPTREQHEVTAGAPEASTSEDGGQKAGLEARKEYQDNVKSENPSTLESGFTSRVERAAALPMPQSQPDVPPSGEVEGRADPCELAAAGCFVLHKRYAGGVPVKAATAKECQYKCLEHRDCARLTFVPSTAYCEHVYVEKGTPLCEAAVLEEFRGAIAAKAACRIPGELLVSIPSAGVPRRGYSLSSTPLSAIRDLTRKKLAASKAAAVTQKSIQECSDSYTLSDIFKGDDFWEPSKFFFFEWGDPTGGTVEYVGKADAQKYNLIKTMSDGRIQLLTDTTEVLANGKGRKSVRLTSQKAWRDALWVLDLNHMPTGCGTWPAWWTVGWDPWPDTGEIDIIEGANLQEHAHAAVHTKKGCVMPSSTDEFNGRWTETVHGQAIDCWDLATSDNVGCSIESYEDAYGAPLNRKGGGLYVMQLHHSKYIRIWFFTRQEAPLDLTSGTPTPDFWNQKPLAYFTLGSNCKGDQYFGEQRIVINTTFCGGYAGYTFSEAQGCPGNGLTDCEKYVRENPSAFREAYWDIKSIKVYQRSGQHCQTIVTTTTTTGTLATSTEWTGSAEGTSSSSGSANEEDSEEGGGGASITTTSTYSTTTRRWWPWPSAAAHSTLASLVLIIPAATAMYGFP
ncbi:PAN domain-containing protein [Cyclospora cayetanensis]|uniref:PAN domain-containing protein n=1 Tax=Cyclospora cayetanensis TaxID=88456 RepID=A0A1D3D057_9EIME|nr:PAN domain-containing protein [Cyclospora cayetanensis]